MPLSSAGAPVGPAPDHARPGEPPPPHESPEPMPPELTTIQPGGGRVMALELAWGRVRRWYLETFRRGYIERMRQTRRGTRNPAPHAIHDPRDAKFYANQPGGWHWLGMDDPFEWRNHVPFARWGLAELFVFSGLLFGPFLGWCLFAAFDGDFAPGQLVDGDVTWDSVWFWTACVLLIPACLSVWFFRDPVRGIPDTAGACVSPADGTVAEVTELDHHPFVGGPAVRVALFLSIFDVHVNRWPIAGRVVGLDYHPGEYLDARDPESVTRNEQLHVRLVTTDPADGVGADGVAVEGGRRMVIHLIAGAIARRIVSIVKPGDVLPRGARIGMIKLGSRTELIVPREDGLVVDVAVGDKVRGGSTVLLHYRVDV